ncbi:aspartate kinase [Desulfurobacterium thermolithotrophum DSM 11699]|uniref:Aspartokinase n=1 Tax=Desulfurobacterium thermolithotrophum (strain DSM 11699 / BSA) TaxID=868864 RepID=F0S1F7_DESTD|nr:aspartate kinase [Desulfurobacterium thermolithotrophum]ADY72888.1 aspartate kinase [Desulfurobacterium thermolithotrophum DSM 11699]
MALVVQKFGGTSMGSIERIKHVARRVLQEKEKGNDVVVVVSAMAGETDRLINLVKEITAEPNERDMDFVVSTGEQVSAGLLSIVLNNMGYPAVSLTGWQAGIKTDNAFTKARILDIDVERIKKHLKEGKLVVITGFQGITEEGDITTLGRGGSDTSAVALAAALNADRCDIYTDVDGVYTADPRIVPQAKRIDVLSYEEMLELASLGAKVLQIRSVEFAMKYNVPLRVRSTFTEDEGTLIKEEDETMERVVVRGIAHNKNEARITVERVPDKPGIAARIFDALAEANIPVDMIVQNVSVDGYTDISFTVEKNDASKAEKITKEVANEIGARNVIRDDRIAKVSVVGLGMRSHAGVAGKVFETLAKYGINIVMISTSEIKISCIVEEKFTELAVRVLHEAFGLDKSE